MDVVAPVDAIVTTEVVVDSSYTYDQAVLSVLEKAPDCPRQILDKLVLVDLMYWSFDSKLHRGQLVVDKRLEPDVRDVFAFMRSIKFPIGKVIPIAAYGWDDNRSMEDNNTVSFDYRPMTEFDSPSNHSRGWAIDINTFLNPYMSSKVVLPNGASYQTGVPGTITYNSEVVRAFNELGWAWGGNWQTHKDYQHFEKVLE